MVTQRETERLEAIKWLRVKLHPNDTVYTAMTHVSSSGMLRVIRAIIIEDNTPLDISYYVSQVLGWSRDRNHDGVRVSGCGMDMGWHLVYSLSSALFRDDFTCVGEGCPSNDHVNGDRNYEPHKHSDGGYALRQRWL